MLEIVSDLAFFIIKKTKELYKFLHPAHKALCAG